MTDAMKGLLTFLTVLLIGFFLGLGFGWKFWRSTAKPIPAPIVQAEIHQEDGSEVLAVKPVARLKPQQLVPVGSHVEATANVVIQPNAVQLSAPTTPGAETPAAVPCPPVRIDMTLTRDADGHRRMVVSSPDGKIVSGEMEVPDVVGPPAPKLLRNSAGLVLGTTAWGDKAVGAYYDRDWKFIRVGGELTKNTYAVAGRQGWEIRGKFGIIF